MNLRWKGRVEYLAHCCSTDAEFAVVVVAAVVAAAAVVVVATDRPLSCCYRRRLGFSGQLLQRRRLVPPAERPRLLVI